MSRVWTTVKPEWLDDIEGLNVDVVPKADYDEMLRRMHVFEADVRRILKTVPEITQRQLENAAERAFPDS